MLDRIFKKWSVIIAGSVDCSSTCQKTFDIINHYTLIDKVECYSIREVALRWFNGFLSNRRQYAVVAAIRNFEPDAIN